MNITRIKYIDIFLGKKSRITLTKQMTLIQQK